MSLGGARVTPLEQAALAKAEKVGVTVVAASGNDGTAIVSFPAAIETVIAVGATDIKNQKAKFSQWGPELDIVAPGVDVISSVPQGTGRASLVDLDLGNGYQRVNSTSFVGSKAVENPIVGKLKFVGLGKPEDFSNLDLNGFYALIKRGEITFVDKVKNALSAGAEGVIIFNNTEGLIQGSVTEDGSELTIPVVMIEQKVGETALSSLQAGKSVQIKVKTEKTDYAGFQGTSMATPHVSGVVALVKSAKKTLTPAQVRNIIKSTATPLAPNDQNQLGAGLVNAEKAVTQSLQ
jgi:serine protease